MSFPDDGSSHTKLDPEDAAAIHVLAGQLHALEIARFQTCVNIAIDLIDAGCSSLESLVDDGVSINSIEELKEVLGTLKNVQLTRLQLLKILSWIQRRRQGLAAAPEQNAGDKRPLPSASPPSPAAQQPRLPNPEPAAVKVEDGIALQDAGAEAEGEGGSVLAGDAGQATQEIARNFMEIMCFALPAVFLRAADHIDECCCQVLRF
jgi:hypothetical protein